MAVNVLIGISCAVGKYVLINYLMAKSRQGTVISTFMSRV